MFKFLLKREGANVEFWCKLNVSNLSEYIDPKRKKQSVFWEFPKMSGQTAENLDPRKTFPIPGSPDPIFY